MIFGASQKLAAFKRRLKNTCKRLPREDDGAVGLMFGLGAIPLVLAVGMAVDHANQVDIKSKLQAATDAAVLAAAKKFELDEDDMKDLAQTFFDANFQAGAAFSDPALDLAKGEECVDLTSSVDADNSFMGMVGEYSTTITVDSRACRATTGMELILVFDNTGSMNNNGRLPALKDAATHLTNILFGDKESSDTLKIGIVPFSQAVNVGTDFDKNWLDRKGDASVSHYNFKAKGWHNWKAWKKIDNRDWNGCVEARKGDLAVDDTPPTTGDTLFTPFFAPDEPGDNEYESWVDGNKYRNSYLEDSKTKNLDIRQRHQAKYKNSTVTSSSRGPGRGCDMQPVTPLTGDKQTILDAIDSMTGNGYTHIAEGVAWGLRVISPGAPFTEGGPYGNDQIPKVMIMLTDGENTFDTESNHNESTYTAYGYLDQERLGSSDYWTAIGEQNDLVEQACDNVKDQDIIVYSFAYEVYNQTAKDLMKYCASDPEKFFDPPTTDQLKEYFEAIAEELRGLYLNR